MTYDEISDNISSNRWSASEQVRIDVEILRRGRVRIAHGERAFFGILGLVVTTYSEFSNNIGLLCVGISFLMIAVIGILDQRRRDRINAWLHEIKDVKR